MNDLEQLDADIAEKLMGYAGRILRYPTGPAIIDSAFPVAVSAYSARMDLAMEVVAKMKERSAMIALEWYSSADGVGDWAATFYLPGGWNRYAEATSLPEAICRAAIRVVENQP